MTSTGSQQWQELCVQPGFSTPAISLLLQFTRRDKGRGFLPFRIVPFNTIAHEVTHPDNEYNQLGNTHNVVTDWNAGQFHDCACKRIYTPHSNNFRRGSSCMRCGTCKYLNHSARCLFYLPDGNHWERKIQKILCNPIYIFHLSPLTCASAFQPKKIVHNLR